MEYILISSVIIAMPLFFIASSLKKYVDLKQANRDAKRLKRAIKSVQEIKSAQ